MDGDNIGLIPQDQPTKDPATAQARKQVKDSLWRIDRAFDDGQIVAPPDDGKRPENTIYVPDDKNSV